MRGSNLACRFNIAELRKDILQEEFLQEQPKPQSKMPNDWRSDGVQKNPRLGQGLAGTDFFTNLYPAVLQDLNLIQ